MDLFRYIADSKNIIMNQPKVGVATIIKNDKNEILLGFRIGKLGYRTWGLPGGKLDFGEDTKECAKRELKEETNLDVDVDDLTLAGVTSAIYDEETHYITIIYEAKKYKNEISLTEPEKCEKWEWFSLDNLPNSLFLPLNNYVLSGGLK